MLDHLSTKVLQAYLTDCQVRQLAPRTIQSYKEILHQFVSWCGDVPLTSVDADRLRNYILDINQTHSPRGVHLYYRFIRTWLLWWETETDGAYRSPTHKVKAPRKPKEPLEPVSVEHVKALLNTCYCDYLGTRDRALLTILLDTGARARELLHVQVDKVDATLGTIQVLGKGSKTRTLYLGDTARKLLRKWLILITPRGYGVTGAVFAWGIPVSGLYSVDVPLEPVYLRLRPMPLDVNSPYPCYALVSTRSHWLN